ncbi:alpha-1,6-glucosidase domain-containing protein [Undibacterium sp. TJN19]|uniref:alpha-1,6-glucosidase domain-containing protein n=1 Tax=Undibacterium sp. TJN19 TaxID=3413055 RepID=UPI003BF2E642
MLAKVRSGKTTAKRFGHLPLMLAMIIYGLGNLTQAAENRSTSVQSSAALAACNGSDFQTSLIASQMTGTDARAYWLSARLIRWPGLAATARVSLYSSSNGQLQLSKGKKVEAADTAFRLKEETAAPDATLAERFSFAGTGPTYRLDQLSHKQLQALLRHQLLIVAEDDNGNVIDFTGLQIAGTLDDIYRAAAHFEQFGVRIAKNLSKHQTAFNLWAPTAQQVSICIYPDGKSQADAVLPMQFDDNTGIWHGSSPKLLTAQYYTYLADVYVPGKGLIRNRVTDPYSISLTTDSRRSYIADLTAAALKPAGWDRQTITDKVKNQTDMQVYELHVRDFSINDHSVRPAFRGKFLAFTEAKSNGMRHLQALSKAGLTDIHLLPVFDFATVPEAGCQTPAIQGAADGADQQKMVMQYANVDCYNWGYEPFHYSAPEGSYATDASDGASRILEFRKMVMALHGTGLRVGMDVVYNHTAGAGQTPYAVLDRIVPGYYQRLNNAGQIERSTCCDNTATENRMMAKLMSDSVLLWARHYKIDSFRFDLMGHQPRQVMEDIRARLKTETGHDIQLIGEGWNFGEVANNARFVQASQLSLNGSHIASFSDRARDALRGGGHGDSGNGIVKNQGYINGLIYAPNALADKNKNPVELLRTTDMVRVGLAGSLRDYKMLTWTGQQKRLEEMDYAGQPAGYVSQPDEVVNYVENHDNQTLFDINAYRLPADTSREDRARVQGLALATTAFSQGIAYYHAGVDILRSKSMDGNSFNSGDWFNRLDWTYQDNYFATGLPPEKDNGRFYPYITPLLANPDIKPSPQDIAFTRDLFRDLLQIRASSSLFRLTTAHEVSQRLHFYNTGASQNPLIIAAHLNGDKLPGAAFQNLMYFINISPHIQELRVSAQSRHQYMLHPVHMQAQAADKRIAAQARYESVNGQFVIPARSAVVFVEKLMKSDAAR